MASVAVYYKAHTIKQVIFTCTTDGSGDSTGSSTHISGEVQRVVIVPGAGVSANFTIKITDYTTKDILESDGNTGQIISDNTNPTEFNPGKMVDSTLTCTIAAGGDTKVVSVYI